MHHVLQDEIYWSLSIKCSENYIRQHTGYDKQKLYDRTLELSRQFFPLIRQMIERTPVEQMRGVSHIREIGDDGDACRYEEINMQLKSPF